MPDGDKVVTLLVRTTTEGIEKTKAQLTELGVAYTQTEQRITQQATSLERVTARFDEGFRASQRYAAGLAQIQRAYDVEIQKTGDVAKADELLAIAKAGLTRQYDAAMARAQRNVEALSSEAIAARAAAAAAEAQAAKSEALRQKYDLLYAAQQKYRAKLQEISEAEKAGLSAPLADAARADTKAVFANQVRDINGTTAATQDAEAAAAAAAKQAAANDLLLQKYVPLQAAQAAYQKQLAEIAALEKAFPANAEALASARDKVTTAYAAQVAELDGTAAAERAAADAEKARASAVQAVLDKLDPQAAKARKVADETARLNALVGPTGLTMEQAGTAAANYAKELDGLGEAHGKATSWAGRLREAMVLFHEFLSGRWKQAIGSATIELQKFGLLGLLLNPLTLGIIAIGAAVAGTIAIMQRFAESQKELAAAVKIGGDATGYTKDQLNALADATERTTNVSTREARSIEAAFASTGRIGGQTLVELTHLTGDFAAATGKNSKEAAGELAKIFADPVKGAKQLDEAYNLLDASQLRDIKNLSEQGKLEEARQRLIDALTPRIEHSAEKVTALGKAWEQAGKYVDHVLESIGKIGTAPSLDEQIASVQRVLANAQRSPVGITLAGDNGLPSLATAGDAQKRLDELNALKKAQEDKAAADKKAADDRIEGNAADELVHKYDPLLDKKQKLINDQTLLNKVIADGVGNLDQERAALAGVSSALDHLRTPLEEAQKKLDIARQVSAIRSPTQRAVAQARLTEEDRAAQSTDPNTSTNAQKLGDIAGQTVATGQISAANDAAAAELRRAAAEDRLAIAAGKGATAVREATIANQAAEFAFTHGGVAVDKYRTYLEQATAAEQKREIAATVLQLNQQADASDRLAAAEQKGAAAGHQAQIENRAIAEALKVAGGDITKFTAAYNQYLDALSRADKASGEEAIQKELRARQDSLAIAELELSLTQRNVETRGAEVAALREKLRLQEQFPTSTQDELDKLVQIAAQEGKINAQIKENDKAEKDYATVAKTALTDVTTAITDMANGTKSFRDALVALEQQLLKLGEEQFVTNPLKQFLDKQVGQGGVFGQGSGLASLLGFGGAPKIQGVRDYTAPIGPSFGTGEPLPAALLPGIANDNALAKAGTDLTSAATKLGTDTAQKLTGAASDLSGVKNLLTTTTTMNVQAGTVTVAGGAAGGSSGLGGLADLFGGSGASTALGSGSGGLGTAAGDAFSTEAIAAGGAFGLAKGGIVGGGNIIPFATGSAFSGGDVFNSPTYFPLKGNRVGMLGEAGDEAVMPLVRGPGGRLGVQAHGGQGGSPTVVQGGHTINQQNHYYGEQSQGSLDRARRSAGQQSRDVFEQLSRKQARLSA